MKTPRIANSVGQIDDDLITAAVECKQKKKSNWVKWGSLAACFAVLVIAGAAILPSFLGGNTPAVNNDRYKDNIDETEKNNKTFTLIVDSLSTGELTEFAADMYRPQGYDEHIGSVLALKIEISNNTAQKYPVIIYRYNNGELESLEELLLNVNAEEELLNSKNVIRVEIANNTGASNQYFSELNAEQIFALAQRGIYCRYVGSGKTGELAVNWWETDEGINTFAECYGDQYILNPNSDIQSIHDIFAE